MSKILITSLAALPDAMALHEPSHIVSLLSSGYMIDTPKGFPAERHLRLSIHDIVDEGLPESPAHRHIEQLIEFSRSWDATTPMIVHCWAGISRSTAATFTILTDRGGPGSEDEIATLLRAHAPHALPNKLIVRLADEALGRGGAMVRAIDRIGGSSVMHDGRIAEIPLESG